MNLFFVLRSQNGHLIDLLALADPFDAKMTTNFLPILEFDETFASFDLDNQIKIEICYFESYIFKPCLMLNFRELARTQLMIFL